MILGAMSDSHDHVDNLNRAIALFVSRGASHLIHAGDFTSPFTQRAFKHYTNGFTAIFGNNDGDRLALSNIFNGSIYQQPHFITLNNRKIAIVHEPGSVNALADSGHFDLVIYGHTHEAVIKKQGNTLVVNPGEVCGWVHGKPSVAIINLEKMEAEIVGLSTI